MRSRADLPIEPSMTLDLFKSQSLVRIDSEKLPEYGYERRECRRRAWESDIVRKVFRLSIRGIREETHKECRCSTSSKDRDETILRSNKLRIQDFYQLVHPKESLERENEEKIWESKSRRESRIVSHPLRSKLTSNEQSEEHHSRTPDLKDDEEMKWKKVRL